MSALSDDAKRTTIRASLCLSLIHWSSFAIEISLIAFLGKDLEIDDIHFGYLSTAAALCQLLTGPFYSHLASANLRNALRVSFISSSISYFLMAMASGFWTLLLSRMASLFAHAAVATQAAVAACTTSEERTAYFGKLGATTGAGFMLGAAIGGSLARSVGLRFPLYLTGSVCAVTALLGPMFIRVDSSTSSSIKQDGDKATDSKGLKGYLRLLTSKRVRTILLAKNLVFAPMMLAMTIMGVYMIKEFRIGPGQNATLSVFMGTCMTVMNAGGVGLMKRYFSDRILLVFGMGGFTLNGIGMVLARSHSHFFLVMLFQAIGISLVASSTDSMLTSSVHANDHALVASLGWTLDSITRVAGPMLAAFMLSQYGFASFGYTLIVGSLVAACLVYGFIRKTPHLEHKD